MPYNIYVRLKIVTFLNGAVYRPTDCNKNKKQKKTNKKNKNKNYTIRKSYFWKLFQVKFNIIFLLIVDTKVEASK